MGAQQGGCTRRARLNLGQKCNQDLGVDFLALRFGHEDLNMCGLLEKWRRGCGCAV